jgi:hypothetical protein
MRTKVLNCVPNKKGKAILWAVFAAAAFTLLAFVYKTYNFFFGHFLLGPNYISPTYTSGVEIFGNVGLFEKTIFDKLIICYDKNLWLSNSD